jgi:hypothetical protein
VGTIIAGQAQLDPKPAGPENAANAIGLNIGTPDSLAVTADGTVFFTSPAGSLHAITPAGAYVARPKEAKVGSRLNNVNGDLLFVDAAGTRIMAASSVEQFRPLLSVKGEPLAAGAPIAAIPNGGGYLFGHTLIDIDGDQSDFLLTSKSLAGKPEAQKGLLPTTLAYNTSGRLFVGYSTGNIYDVQPGGLIFNTYGGAVSPTIAADAQGRLMTSGGGRVTRREPAGKSVDVAHGLDCGAIAFAPDGTLYYVDVGAIRRIKPGN